MAHFFICYVPFSFSNEVFVDLSRFVTLVLTILELLTAAVVIVVVVVAAADVDVVTDATQVS
jgi:hypothetical protein